MLLLKMLLRKKRSKSKFLRISWSYLSSFFSIIFFDVTRTIRINGDPNHFSLLSFTSLFFLPFSCNTCLVAKQDENNRTNSILFRGAYGSFKMKTFKKIVMLAGEEAHRKVAHNERNDDAVDYAERIRVARFLVTRTLRCIREPFLSEDYHPALANFRECLLELNKVWDALLILSTSSSKFSWVDGLEKRGENHSFFESASNVIDLLLGSPCWTPYCFADDNAPLLLYRCVMLLALLMQKALMMLNESVETEGTLKLVSKVIAGSSSTARMLLNDFVEYRKHEMLESSKLAIPIETTVLLVRVSDTLLLLKARQEDPSFKEIDRLFKVVCDLKTNFALAFFGMVWNTAFFHSFVLPNSEIFSFPLNIKPGVLSIWIYSCEIVKRVSCFRDLSSNRDSDIHEAGKVLLGCFFTEMANSLIEISESTSQEKICISREVTFLTLFLRLWRDYMGHDVYHNVVRKVWFRLLSNAAIELLDDHGVPESRKHSDEIEDNFLPSEMAGLSSERVHPNTANFFAFVWAIPALSREEVKDLIKTCVLPWDPSFCRATSIRVLASNSSIHVTHSICRRLRLHAL